MNDNQIDDDNDDSTLGLAAAASGAPSPTRSRAQEDKSTIWDPALWGPKFRYSSQRLPPVLNYFSLKHTLLCTQSSFLFF